jgi:hypothetical protein
MVWCSLARIKKETLDPEMLKNYRPITNLSFLSKTLERLAATQLNEYLSENGLHSKMKSAYRANHSTETALIRVCNDINIALDTHKEVILVLLDLSSAFDTIDHDILSTRLQDNFGLSGTVLKWIKSYLRNRTQSIVIDNSQSETSQINRGVPQGSILGPLLFSLYISPIEDIIRAHGLHPMLYADDTQMYFTFEKTDRLITTDKLKCCSKDVMLWMVKNKLICNASKTECVHFCSRFVSTELISEVVLNDDLVEPSPTARDLGVILDQHLKMSPHVNSLCRSAILALKRISRIRRCPRLVGHYDQLED